MMDLLEIFLSFVLELVPEFWDWDLCRLFLPVVGALGLILLIRATVSNSTVQFILGAPVAILGVLTGISWQGRKG